MNDEQQDAFDSFLRDAGLMERTRRAYRGVVERSPDGDVARYVRKLVRDRAPVGTVVQAHAAASKWLKFQGMPEAEIKAALPSPRGRRGATREALSPEALARYLTVCEAQGREPMRSILLLLPRTGLRISEACALTRGNVAARSGKLHLRLRGKGDKPRKIPLGPAGEALVRAAVERLADGWESPEGAPLFTLRAGRPVAPGTVRDHLCRLRTGDALLQGVTPHVLRHTYATRALAGGVDTARLQVLLGHASITTTQRYLHPTLDDLADAVSGVEGL